jgi:hypothetical protein
LAGVVVLVAPLEVLVVAVGVVLAAAGVVAGAAVELVVAAVGVLWVLEVELLLLPQPATSAPPANATTSHVDSFRINDPLGWKGRSPPALQPFGNRPMLPPPRGRHLLPLLGNLGVVDRPAEPLDELRGGVVVAEMFGADALVEEHGGVGSLALLGRDDDSGHEIGLPGFDEVAVVFDPPS